MMVRCECGRKCYHCEDKDERISNQHKRIAELDAAIQNELNEKTVWMLRAEKAEQLATQRGARMQIMMEWMSHTDMTDPDVTNAFSWVADAFTFAYPESKDWFTKDGVPVREWIRKAGAREGE